MQIFNISIKPLTFNGKFHFRKINWPVLASLIIIAQEYLYLFWLVNKELSGEKGCGGWGNGGTLFSIIMKIYLCGNFCFEYESEGVHALRHIYG